MLKRIIGFLAVASILVVLLIYSQWRSVPRTVSGMIEVDEIRVGSRVGGRVQQVHVVEGQRVEAGELLVELEPFNLEALRAEAAQRLAAAEAQYEERVAGFRAEEVAQAQARRDELAATLDKLVKGPRQQEVNAARAELELVTAQRQLAKSTLDRVSEASARGAANPAEVDQAVESLQVAEARVASRQEALSLLLEGTRPEEITEARARLEQAEQEWRRMTAGYRKEEIASAMASMEAARAALAALDRQIEELKIRAPVASLVEAIDLEPGDLIAPNAPALSLVVMDRLWIRAYIPATALDLRIGDRLWITVDAFPDQRFVAAVAFIARQAEFTPRNVQTPEERSKQVFRIKLRIEDDDHRLRPGMFADVRLDERPATATGPGEDGRQ